MSKGTAYTWPQLGGLSTTGNEDGLEQPRFTQFQNLRVSDGTAKRRKGMVRVARVTTTGEACNLDGTDDAFTIPLNATVHTLKRLWTLEALVKADSFATNAKTIFGVAHAANYSIKVYFTTAGLLEVKVQDSAAAVTTLTSATTFSTGTAYAVQVVRDGTALTLRVNGTSEATGTMADLDCLLPGGNLYIGRDNAGNYFDGIIDFVRCEAVAKTDQRYGFTRHPYPKVGTMLWDYLTWCTGASADHLIDRSRNNLHAAMAGTATSASGNVLSVQSDPIYGIAEWMDANTRRRLFVASGAALYLPTLVK